MKKMADRNFMEMIQKKWSEGKFVCVGLDSDIDKVRETISFSKFLNFLDGNSQSIYAIWHFNKAIIESTKDLVCAYKPNIAFYEAHGLDGRDILEKTINYIHSVCPDVPVILDAKRGDIGNTNAGYVKGSFDDLIADAITLHPYLGQESLQPFLKLKDKGCIILCRTSNPGAGEFQDLIVDGIPLYQYVAKRVSNFWNKNGNCLLVVGATYIEELRQVREIVGDMPILIPGIGAQGGDLEKSVLYGKDSHNQGIIINSSRGIIFASKGPDFAQAAREETQKLNDQIVQYLQM